MYSILVYEYLVGKRLQLTVKAGSACLRLSFPPSSPTHLIRLLSVSLSLTLPPSLSACHVHYNTRISEKCAERHVLLAKE